MSRSNAYISVVESLKHAGVAHRADVEIIYENALKAFEHLIFGGESASYFSKAYLI